MSHLCSRAIMLSSLLGAASPALAGQFNISPTRVELTDRQSSVLLTLENTGDEEARFQITPNRWDQAGDELVILGQTEDIVVYPSLITLDPGESRRIRVGTTLEQGDEEAAYRLIIDELPTIGEDGVTLGVQVHTRASLPVFIAAERGIGAGAIERKGVSNGQLELEIVNEGNTHFMLRQVEVTGYGTADNITFTDEIPGWYVLPGVGRPVMVDIPAEVCLDTRRIEVRAVTDQGTWNRNVGVGTGRCPEE